ncbi:RNA-directed DNA polymerase (reverse transcriptase)-related family protein [Raphanus sativus]|nr:RNA-directed DNA polymerase (reverse transcriptase)-related family protein [Raphanus sativus]
MTDSSFVLKLYHMFLIVQRFNSHFWLVTYQITNDLNFFEPEYYYLRSIGLDVGCDIGNGSTASYWCDDWFPHGPLIDFIGATGPCKMGILISSTVLQACSSNGWILPSARCRSPPIAALRTTLLECMSPDPDAPPNQYTWGVSGNRAPLFSIKTTWEFIRESAPFVFWEKAVWFRYAVPKQ